MNSKAIIWLGLGVGSAVGSLVPALWGASPFGVTSILFGALGGIAGIWGGYRLTQW